MKILIATGIYPPDIGGPATYSKLLFDELPKHGFEVKILSFGSVRHLPKLIRHFVYFCKFLKTGRDSDIIFAQDPVSVGLPALSAAKILRKKFILKIVGDYAWEQGMQRFGVKDLLDDFVNKKYSWPIQLFKRIQEFVANRADIIIVPSEYLKKIVSRWGVNENKIRVIYNSFEVPAILLNKEEARQKLNLSGTVLVSAGRLVPWKGFGVLVEIMPQILREIPDAKLVIIGDGPERNNLESRIKNFRLDNRVFLLGKITHEELLYYLKAGDIFILNTGYEGFSHQLLEAMAMEIPIITTEIGGNPEIIEDKKEGVLVKYGDKEAIRGEIINLYKNKDLRNQIVQNAKIKLRGFSKGKMLKEIIKILCGF